MYIHTILIYSYSLGSSNWTSLLPLQIGNEAMPYHVGGGSDSCHHVGGQEEWPLCGRYRPISHAGVSTWHPHSSIALSCAQPGQTGGWSTWGRGRLGGTTNACTCPFIACANVKGKIDAKGGIMRTTTIVHHDVEWFIFVFVVALVRACSMSGLC